MNDFRIVELNGSFRIERKFLKETKKGILWWEKIIKEYVWKDINKYGGEYVAMYLYGKLLTEKMCEFKTLEEADKALEKILTPTVPIYHYR